MDKGEKKLLITDLCARLPYAVKINCNGETGPYTRPSMECTVMYEIAKVDNETDCWVVNGYDISQVKPYLRPINSLSEKEEAELENTFEEIYDFSFRMEELMEFISVQKTLPSTTIEWLNAHHVDYRGLIPKGLALKAKEDMYNN